VTSLGWLMFGDREVGVEINNDDVRLAKAEWLVAWESDASNDRVSLLYDDYVRLVSAQAQQLADRVRRSKPRLVE
jgi:hypothetical protein